MRLAAVANERERFRQNVVENRVIDAAVGLAPLLIGEPCPAGFRRLALFVVLVLNALAQFGRLFAEFARR